MTTSPTTYDRIVPEIEALAAALSADSRVPSLADLSGLIHRGDIVFVVHRPGLVSRVILSPTPNEIVEPAGVTIISRDAPAVTPTDTVLSGTQSTRVHHAPGYETIYIK